ncbi:MAG: response regulator transcription factor [Actinomycetota bacterium]|nr:response regulator transcription factor [Actinomycetota bacterium]
MKVLIVDDSSDARFLLRKRLESRKQFQVVGEAASGIDAVEQVEALRPDLVIMDISMPGMDGVEATRLIKERFPATSVLALSSFDDDEHVAAMCNAGAVGYVLKNASQEELIMCLQDSQGRLVG